MSKSYKSKGKKILEGILISLIVIMVISSLCIILDRVVPSVHGFFNSVLNWFKSLFNSGKEIVSDTSAIIHILKN